MNRILLLCALVVGVLATAAWALGTPAPPSESQTTQFAGDTSGNGIDARAASSASPDNDAVPGADSITVTFGMDSVVTDLIGESLTLGQDTYRITGEKYEGWFYAEASYYYHQVNGDPVQWIIQDRYKITINFYQSGGSGSIDFYKCSIRVRQERRQEPVTSGPNWGHVETWLEIVTFGRNHPFYDLGWEDDE